MKGRGKRSCREPVDHAVPANEVKLTLGPKKIRETNRSTKVLEIRAAAETDVLAVVDLDTRRLIDKRAGPAA